MIEITTTNDLRILLESEIADFVDGQTQQLSDSIRRLIQSRCICLSRQYPQHQLTRNMLVFNCKLSYEKFITGAVQHYNETIIEFNIDYVSISRYIETTQRGKYLKILCSTESIDAERQLIDAFDRAISWGNQ